MRNDHHCHVVQPLIEYQILRLLCLLFIYTKVHLARRFRLDRLQKWIEVTNWRIFHILLPLSMVAFCSRRRSVCDSSLRDSREGKKLSFSPCL